LFVSGDEVAGDGLDERPLPASVEGIEHVSQWHHGHVYVRAGVSVPYGLESLNFDIDSLADDGSILVVGFGEEEPADGRVGYHVLVCDKERHQAVLVRLVAEDEGGAGATPFRPISFHPDSGKQELLGGCLYEH
jgi:hypothetical protein